MYMYVLCYKLLCQSQALSCCELLCFLPVLRAMEQFMSKCPEHVNLTSDYAFTPLHMAACYNVCDIVTLLAETVNPYT